LLGGRARGRRSRDNDAFASTRGHGRGASNIRQPRPLLVVQFAIPNCSYPVRQETTIVAYEMNDQPLPHFNGFPARVIVPGWTGTYWMKHIISINAVTEPFTGFWMNSAYSIPLRAFPLVERSPRGTARLDGGCGIRAVEILIDGGARPRRDASMQGAESHETNDHMVRVERCLPLPPLVTHQIWDGFSSGGRPVTEEQVSEWSLLDSFTGPAAITWLLCKCRKICVNASRKQKRNRPPFPPVVAGG